MSKLSFIRGQDVEIPLEFTEDGSPLNITGATVVMTIKAQNNNSADDAGAVKKTVTIHGDPVNGKTGIIISNSETKDLVGTYNYDIVLIGQDSSVLYFQKDIIEFIDNVTKVLPE